MAYNFREDQINEMYSLYTDSLDTIQRLAKSVVDKMSEKATELKYDPVVKVCRAVVSYYNEELKQNELRALQSWQDSEMSFENIMKLQKAGENAVSRSRTLESNIDGQIQAIQPVGGEDLDTIDTTNWKCEKKDFQDFKQIIDRFIKELEIEQKQYETKISAKMEDNTIYVSIKPVIIQTFSIVSEGFKSGITESFSELANEFEERENAVKAKGASASETAAHRAQSLSSEGVNDLKNKLRTIWE